MQLLYALFALDLLNLAVFLPVFSPFVTSIGGTPFILGLINSSSALISLLWNPVVGSLSDQVGRKGLLLKCILASAIGSLLMASSSSLLIVFVGKLIGALGSPVQILLRSIVADTYKTADEKKTFFNKCAPVMSLAFLVGSVSSGFLSEAKHGYSLAFLVMATCMGLAALFTKNSLKDDTKQEKVTKNIKNKSMISQGLDELKKAAINIKSISWERYGLFFAIRALYEIGMAMIFNTIGIVLLQDFSIKGRYMGLVFLMSSILAIISTIIRLKLTVLFNKITDQDIIIKGGSFLIFTFLGMAASGSASLFLFFLGLWCVAKSYADTTMAQIITVKTTEQDKGKVIGAYENLVPFAAFLAPMISGIIAEMFGARMVMILASLPMIVTVYVGTLLKNKTE